MSKSQTKPTSQPVKDRSSRVWVAMSLFLALTMGVWLCYQPFASDSPVDEMATAKRASGVLIFSKDVAIRGGSLEEVREFATELDHQFLEELAEKNRPSYQDDPDGETVYQKWRGRYERAKQQVQDLGEIEEDSVEMGFKNDRLKALADRPPAF